MDCVIDLSVGRWRFCCFRHLVMAEVEQRQALDPRFFPLGFFRHTEIWLVLEIYLTLRVIANRPEPGDFARC